MTHELHWLNATDPPDAFPASELAFRDPDGLLAAGGDLSEARLLAAYRRGIFPWYSEQQPILWWTPDPRTVLFPQELHISRSLRRRLKQQVFEFALDRNFDAVMRACAETPRPGQDGSWITQEMQYAYQALHRSGWAHSVEVYADRHLVGGIYGIAIGKVFFGESMFSHATDASKAAMVVLVKQLQAWRFALIDCQVENAHLVSLGARNLPRSTFEKILREHATGTESGPWQLDIEVGDLHRFDPTRCADW